MRINSKASYSEEAMVEKEDAKKDSKSGEKKKQPDPEEWMRAHGLSFPLKEHLTRIAALLSPLLAGPVSELLSFLKG